MDLVDLDLEEILARDNAHIRQKEAEVLAALMEFTAPARQQIEGVRQALGSDTPPEFLSLSVSEPNRAVARSTVKFCTGSLFDVYANAVFTDVIDAEPFIALLPLIGERVRLKLKVIDHDEVTVRTLKWESAAWAREKRTQEKLTREKLTLRRRLTKWLFTSSDVPSPPPDPGAVSMAHSGVQLSSEVPDVNADGSVEVLPGEPPIVGDPGCGDKPREESSDPGMPKISGRLGVEPLASDISGQEIDRSALVVDFLLRCNQEGLTGKLRKKHIWRAVGHTRARQFQYWQKRDSAATSEDDKNFGRILGMQPGEFIALLRKMNLISNKT